MGSLAQKAIKDSIQDAWGVYGNKVGILYAIKTSNDARSEVITSYYTSQPKNGLESSKYTKIQSLKMIVYIEAFCLK